MGGWSTGVQVTGTEIRYFRTLKPQMAVYARWVLHGVAQDAECKKSGLRWVLQWGCGGHEKGCGGKEARNSPTPLSYSVPSLVNAESVGFRLDPRHHKVFHMSACGQLPTTDGSQNLPGPRTTLFVVGVNPEGRQCKREGHAYGPLSSSDDGGEAGSVVARPVFGLLYLNRIRVEAAARNPARTSKRPFPRSPSTSAA